MPKTTDLEIIDKLSLGPRIWDLALNKATKPAGIGELLRSEGVPISDTQITKWIRLQANLHGGELNTYISSHIKRHIPDDMEAIERLEKASLANADKNFKHKIREISKKDELVTYIERKILPLLRGADAIKEDGPRKSQLKSISALMLSQCAEWTLDELKWLSSQREERKIALDAIEIKLKYAQNLRMNSGARINIIQSQVARSGMDGEVQSSPKIVRISRSQTFGSDNS